MKIEQLGPYKIFEPLGRGGMGTVYRALDTSNDRPAAVKVLSPIVAHDSGFRERFEAEIQSLKTLRHPRIVQLYGYGEQDGHLFYAMELVSGHSLQEEISAGRRFGWREAVPIIVDLCGALKHAHDHGVIHRDIKPANLLLVDSDPLASEDANSEQPATERIQVKLADFGIAKLFGNSSLTVDGGVLGTADYMSPEQAVGEPVTPRSDLYSLGCVLYALLAGRPPFRGKSIPEVIHKVRYDVPPSISRFVDDVPEELEQILRQLLAKAPEERVPTALALSNRLQSLQHGLTMKIDRALTSAKEEVEETPPVAATQAELFAQDTMEAGASPEPKPKPETDDSETPPTPDHFVAVKDRHGSVSDSDYRGESPLWRAVTIIALTIPLILIVWGVYRLLAPPSADELFASVSETAKRVDDVYAGAGVLKGPQPDLTVHRAEVASFLRRFPNDPRADQFTEWKQQIAATQLEQRFERTMRMGWESAHTSPLDDLVLRAMKLEATEPQMALKRYQDLLELFPLNIGQERDIELIMRSVRLRMTKLKRQLQKTADLHIALIRDRLAKAKELAASDPERAKKILTAAIDVYGDFQWARIPVAESQRRLEAIRQQSAK